MSSGAPHTYPLRRGVDLVVALAIAAQVFALARCSPWFPLAWCAVLALAVGAAALPRPRAGEVLLSLGARLALYVAALGFAALLLAGFVHAGWTASTYPRAAPALNALAAAFWLWALHAPLAMSRWWVRARPAQDAALEVAEALGLSLVAAALALTAQNDERAWSFALGTAWSTGLCAALGVALVGWAWVAQLRRRAWMRRVLADRDPAWHLVATDDTAVAAEPWTHAGDGAAAPRVLAPRGDDVHYRASQLRVTVARVGARDGLAWWVRRALNVAAAGWGFVLLGWGVWHLLHVAPPDHERDLYARIATMRVQQDPCTERERRSGPGAHRVFEGSREEGFEDGVEVWASGLVGGWHRRARRRRELTAGADWEHCISLANAQALIDDPRSGEEAAYAAIESLRNAADERAPATSPDPSDGRCRDDHWTDIDWSVAWWSAGRWPSSPRAPRCHLDWSGEWQCGVGLRPNYGRLAPDDARALIAGLERLSHQRERLDTGRDQMGLSVRVCGENGYEYMTFRGQRELGDALARRLLDRSRR